MKGTFKLEGNGCSFCQFPVKILNIGQELRKCPFLSLKHKGRGKKKGTVGYQFGLDSKAQSFRVFNHGKQTCSGHMDLSQEQVKDTCWLMVDQFIVTLSIFQIH